MKMRYAILLVVAVVIVAGVIAYQVEPVRDFTDRLFSPTQQYDGHSKGHWIRELSSSDEGVRHEAMHAIGGLGRDAGEEPVPKLTKIMLESTSEKEKAEAALTLQKMGPAAKSAVPALAQALQDKVPLVRMNAAGALAHLGEAGRSVLPQLITAFQDKRNYDNLDSFTLTITDELALAVARASKGTGEGVTVLVKALEDIKNDKALPRVETVQGTGRGNGQVKKGHEHDSTNFVIRTKMIIAKALGELGPEAKPAVPILMDLLKLDQVSDFKIEATRTLGEIGQDAKQAAPLIRQMMEDKNQNTPAFKPTAEEALMKIEGKPLASK